jgi:hypothetical protein
MAISKIVKAHRLVAMAFIGPAPSPGHEVAHGDGNRINNALPNLRWATRSENVRDSIRHGTHRIKWTPGEVHSQAKLSESDVFEIARLLRSGQGNSSIALQFGVHNASISKIKRRETWAHLNLDTDAKTAQREKGGKA